MPENNQGTIKQNFTILWVEDNQSVINLNKRELEPEFEKHFPDFNLTILPAKDESTIKSAFDSNSIDLVVTDFNLASGWDGTHVVKLVKSKRTPTDILFYSATKFRINNAPITISKLYEKIKHYGFIEFSQDNRNKIVSDQVIRLVKKNLRRCEDIVFLRGMVISRVIDLELKINECLGKYFRIPKKRIKQFHDFVMENRNNSLSGKRDAVSKVLTEHSLHTEFKGLLSILRKINENRNLLAHCKTDKNDNRVLVDRGKKEVFDKNRLNKILKEISDGEKFLEKFIIKVQSLS